MKKSTSVTTGITPACAGKSLVFFVSSFIEEDHPRMRGEKFKAFRSEVRDWGSPPHARGKAAG